MSNIVNIKIDFIDLTQSQKNRINRNSPNTNQKKKNFKMQIIVATNENVAKHNLRARKKHTENPIK